MHHGVDSGRQPKVDGDENDNDDKDNLPLVDGDVLLDQPCNLHCLVRLDSVEGIIDYLGWEDDDDQRCDSHWEYCIPSMVEIMVKKLPADPLLGIL